VDALAARARHWVYVSSVSVYADTDVVDADESARLLAPLQADIADRAVYGEAKVACELVGMRVQLLQVLGGMFRLAAAHPACNSRWPAPACAGRW